MTKTIMRYAISDYDLIFVPKGGEIVAVGYKEYSVMLWFLVDPTLPNEQRRFKVVATGDMFEWKYVGTVFNGSYVWHVLEDCSLWPSTEN